MKKNSFAPNFKLTVTFAKLVMVEARLTSNG